MKMFSIIILLFLNCCSGENKGEYFELDDLKKIAQMSSYEPPPAIVSFTPIYVNGLEDSISETSLVKLKYVFINLYQKEYSEFSDFLFDALNKKIKIDAKNPKTYLYFSQTFLIEQKIAGLYKKDGIKGLVDTYCTVSKKGDYALKRGNLTLNEINTISYYFFINQYFRIDDDIKPEISFQKLRVALSMLNQ